MQQKCTCNDIANKKDFWKIGMVDATYWGTVYAYVRCSRCGAEWKTAAKYKRWITGSENYREAFDKEESMIKRILQDEIHKLDQDVQRLNDKKSRLERRLWKITNR